MNRTEAVNQIRGSGVIVIIWARLPAHLLKAADALREGGVCSIEVTMTTPEA